MELLPCTGESGHHRPDRQFQSFGDLPIGEILKVEEDHRKTMSLVKFAQRLMKGKSIRTECATIFRLTEHLVD